MVKGTLVELALENLSLFEQDTLTHFPTSVSQQLMKAFRGGIMLYQNILPELSRRGLRMRIVPEGTNLTDLRECFDLKKYKTDEGKSYYDVVPAGIYWHSQKLLVVKAETLLYRKTVNERYGVLTHEMAHAVWFLLMEEHERQHVRALFLTEKLAKTDDPSYRLYNVEEFFAESFRFFVTPYRQQRILGTTKYVSSFGHILVKERVRENTAASSEHLQRFNLKMYEWVEAKFKGIIDPELVMGQPDRGDELRFDYDPRTQLFTPVLFSGESNA